MPRSMPTACHLRPIHRCPYRLLLRVNVPFRDVHVAVPGEDSAEATINGTRTDWSKNETACTQLKRVDGVDTVGLQHHLHLF
jgi:hypothetical protein